MTNEEKIKKWLAGELSAAERKAFEGSEAFVHIRKLLDAVQHFKAPAYDVHSEYSRLTEARENPENKHRSLHIKNRETGSPALDRSRSRHASVRKKTVTLDDRLRQVFRVAAIFVIALTAGYFLYHQVSSSVDNREWIAEQAEITLPDASIVSLNAASAIRFSEDNWSEERVVELRGEAYFRVKKGQEFTVKTDQGVVTVLGTEFNVKDRGTYFQVTCYSGSVRVTTPQRSLVLQPQSSYRMINGNEENFIYSGEPGPDWLRGESSFRSVPLSAVIDELEIQYEVAVETQNVDVNQLFTGSFSHNNLEIALKSITIPLHLHYEINENKIVITVEGK